MAFATASRSDSERVSEAELRKVIGLRRQGEDWDVILPEIAQLRLVTEGDGVPISLRIQKDAEFALRTRGKHIG